MPIPLRSMLLARTVRSDRGIRAGRRRTAGDDKPDSSEEAARALLPETENPGSEPAARRRTAPSPAGLVSQEDRAVWQRWADEQAQESFRQGQQSWEKGDQAAALRWLERAHRMAPKSPNVAFFLAVVRQANGFGPAAIDLLRTLTRRYDFRQGWSLLAASLLRAGRPGEAAEALSEALSRHACDDDLARLADLITAEAQLPGWCGIDDRGAVRLGGAILSGLAPLSSESTRATPEKGRTRGRSRPVQKTLPAGLSIEIDGITDKLAMVAEGLLWPAVKEKDPACSGPWGRTDTVSVKVSGRPLPGSPLRPSVAMRAEGFVQAGPEGLTGWVWHPNNPERPPVIRIVDATGDLLFSLTAEAFSDDVSSDIPVARYRAFSIPQTDLPDGPVHVFNEAGNDLAGSPIDAGLERRAAIWAARQANLAGSRNDQVSDPPPPFLPVPVATTPCAEPAVSSRFAAGTRPDIIVIVPVYRDLIRTRSCLESLLESLPAGKNRPAAKTHVLIIDDASPEPGMTEMLGEIARDNRVTVHRNARNLGFSASVNIGLQAALPAKTRNRRPGTDGGRDVVLLNSDTLVAEGWLEELQTVAWSDAAIGTVTPLSGDATIMSYPDLAGNAVPTAPQTLRTMRMARAVNGGTAVDVPTAHGFCMYIRHDCLTQTGLFRADLFAQGYGEENDFSLRARCFGWRNVAAPGAYVAHVGSVSFGGTRNALLTRNLGLLNRLHPGYDALISAHVALDPLFEARRRIDLLRWRLDRDAGIPVKHGTSRKSRDRKTDSSRSSVILVTHDYGGGVERVVSERARRLREEGIRPILVRPVEGGCRVEGWRSPEQRREPSGDAKQADAASGLYPNLRFRLPAEWPMLLRLLTADPVLHIEWHHASGHHMAMRELAAEIGAPYDVYVHDYIWFCPRISLMGPAGRYCGEPDTAECEICVTTLGRNVGDDIPVADYVARSAKELKSARTVITPSEDASRRMRRHFPGLPCRVEQPEDDRPDLDLTQFSSLMIDGRTELPAPVAMLRSDRFRICVVGAIGREKGYDVLLEAARDAREKALPLDYIVVGHTPDDQALMETGHVYVTGAYKEEEAVSLVRAQQADYGLIPSVWPETWCLALGVAWRAGLRVAAFDLGAVADRIRATERGVVLPPGISAARLNVILISLCQRSAGTSALYG